VVQTRALIPPLFYCIYSDNKKVPETCNGYIIEKKNLQTVLSVFLLDVFLLLLRVCVFRPLFKMAGNLISVARGGALGKVILDKKIEGIKKTDPIFYTKLSDIGTECLKELQGTTSSVITKVGGAVKQKPPSVLTLFNDTMFQIVKITEELIRNPQAIVPPIIINVDKFEEPGMLSILRNLF
jgi:hypothetical protein